MSLRTLSTSVFEGTADERDKIIKAGRFLYASNMKRYFNDSAKRLRQDIPFSGDAGISDIEYNTNASRWKKAFFGYCAKPVIENLGRTFRGTKEELLDPYVFNDPQFMKNCAVVMSEILSPILPAVASDLLGTMMNIQTIPLNTTKEVTVKSNAIFKFDDTAWGVRAQRAQYLYDKTITLNPKPKAARAVANWYEYIADENRDIGDLFRAMSGGVESLFMGMFWNTFSMALANTDYIPSYLKANSYSPQNQAKLSKKLRAANGNMGARIGWFGEKDSLQGVIPSTAYAGLQEGLGEEWFKVGYLGMAVGDPMYEISHALKPNTVNTTGEGITDDMGGMIIGLALNGDKPVEGAIGGGNIIVEIEPMRQAMFQTEINVMIPIDIAPIFGSKIAVIEGIVL